MSTTTIDSEPATLADLAEAFPTWHIWHTRGADGRLLQAGGGRARVALVLVRRGQRMYVQLDAVEAREVSGVLGRLVEQLRLDALAGQVS